MTARGSRQGLDAEDLDVEEALALVKDGNGTARPAGGHNPAQRGGSGDGTPPSSSRSSPARSPETGHRADAAEQRHRATSWPEARTIAARAARSGAARLAPVSVALGDALGLVLAAPLTALTDLPSFDTSAMDGWAVAGPGPWHVREEGVLAGSSAPAPLADGEAVRIATGARIPRTPPRYCAASTAGPTTTVGCTRPERCSTGRTSARGARNAAAGISCCGPGRW